MNEPLRCALISADEAFRRSVLDVIRDPQRDAELALNITTPVTELRRDALDRVRSARPHVVFLDLGEDPVIGLMFVRALTEETPNQIVILAGPELGAEPLLEVMRAGASEYLPKPVEDGEVVGAFTRATRKLTSWDERDRRRAGITYGVFSTKGGAGVSTTAVNIATHLRNLTGKKTLLLDLDVEFGTTALLLGLKPRYTLLDLVQNLHRMDEGLLESYVERHETGLHLLSPPPRTEDGGSDVGREELRAALSLLRNHYDYIVMDMGKNLAPHTIAALEQTDECLLVATPELPTLRNLKRALPTLLKATAGGGQELHLVLNQFREGTGISRDEVENVLGMDVWFTVEKDDEVVTHSVNVGKPVVLNGASRYGRSMKALSARLAGPDYEKEGGGLIGALTAVLNPFRRKRSQSASDE